MYVELATAVPTATRHVATVLAAGTTGVTLVRKMDESYLETGCFVSRTAVRFALWLVDTFGLEVMDEEECPAELTPSGGTRVYLASKVG